MNHALEEKLASMPKFEQKMHLHNTLWLESLKKVSELMCNPSKFNEIVLAEDHNSAHAKKWTDFIVAYSKFSGESIDRSLETATDLHKGEIKGNEEESHEGFASTSSHASSYDSGNIANLRHMEILQILEARISSLTCESVLATTSIRNEEWPMEFRNGPDASKSWVVINAPSSVVWFLLVNLKQWSSWFTSISDMSSG